MCVSSSCPVTGGSENSGCWGGADSGPPFPMTLPMNGDIREKSIHSGRYYVRGTLSASSVHFSVQSITQILFSGVIIIYSLHFHIESQSISFHLGILFKSNDFLNSGTYGYLPFSAQKFPQFSFSSQLRPSFFELEPLELTDEAMDFGFYQLFHDYSCGFLRS